MANRLDLVMRPYEHDLWRADVQLYYPQAFLQDDTTPAGFRLRALSHNAVVGFFMRPNSTGVGMGYVRIPEVGESEVRAGDQSSPSGGEHG